MLAPAGESGGAKGITKEVLLKSPLWEQFWEPFGTVLGAFGDHFGKMLGAFAVHCWSMLGAFGEHLESIWNCFVASASASASLLLLVPLTPLRMGGSSLGGEGAEIEEDNYSPLLSQLSSATAGAQEAYKAPGRSS